VIDIHSHVLAGVDDGARTLDESVDIARAAAAEGVDLLLATPHVREDYRTRPETMERLVAEVRDALRAAGVQVELRGGGELALDFLPRIPDADLARFGLGGSRALLLEAPYSGWPLDIEDVIFRLRAQGFVGVLAHPERNSEVQENPERLRPLVEAGVLVQVTGASLEGRLGAGSKECGLDLVERELVHIVASDAHTPDVRQYGILAGLEAIGDEELGRWLARDVPAALLAGDPPPERPRRRRFGFLRR
jgi:protein-tyrosine phosphatase